MEKIDSIYNVYILPVVVFVVEMTLFYKLGVYKSDYMEYYDRTPLYVHTYAALFGMAVAVVILYKLTDIKDIYYLAEILVISTILPILIIPAIQTIIMDKMGSSYIDNDTAMIFFNYVRRWYYFPMKVGIELIFKTGSMFLFLFPFTQNRKRLILVILLANVVVASGCILNII